jgi:hypothetical protein
MLSQKLIKTTEDFTGKGTVVSAVTTGMMMVEMKSEELAKKVYNSWKKGLKGQIEISKNRVYAF